MTCRDRVDAAEDAGSRLSAIASELILMDREIGQIYRTTPEAGDLYDLDIDLTIAAAGLIKVGERMISDASEARAEARRREPAETW